MGNVCRKNGEMPISDYFEMSNWEKWRVYNRFPYKMVLAIFLTILTTSHVLILNSYLAPYRRAGYTSWASLLAPPIQPEPPTYAVYETRGKVNLEKVT